MSVIKRLEPGSAYIRCACPRDATSRFTMVWFVDRAWVAKADGASGELIEESLDIRRGWEARVKIHRGSVYLSRLNESTSYCLRCVCRSGGREFVSEPRCVRLADLKPGTVPYKRDWRMSTVVACFAVAGAFVVAGALLTHIGIRDDVSESDVLELIRNPVSVLNLTVFRNDPSDLTGLDGDSSPVVAERGRDTDRSRRNTFGGHVPDLSVDVSARNSV